MICTEIEAKKLVRDLGVLKRNEVTFLIAAIKDCPNQTLRKVSLSVTGLRLFNALPKVLRRRENSPFRHSRGDWMHA
jgi:hypothetical protein